MTAIWHPFDEIRDWSRIYPNGVRTWTRDKPMPLLDQTGVQPNRALPYPPRPVRQPKPNIPAARPEDV